MAIFDFKYSKKMTVMQVDQPIVVPVSVYCFANS